MNAGGGGAGQSGGRITLADLVRQEATARMSEAEKLTAARATRLYFQRPEQPGFLVSETEAGPLVPLFTSVERLALFAGACAWASTTVADIVELLPEGVRALVDPLGERPFLLDVEALREPETAEAETSRTTGEK
ncbi:SseB family protein [Streptomyces sp. NPDC019443]|uniref:SseB family protein n=1 Tax=Streptomyces sp. NPDC019443 TaxID=3365061 RepID=UPI0037B5E1E7